MTNILFDYSKLRGKIKEKYKTERYFSKALGISNVSLSNKLNGIVGFKNSEILKICSLLSIDLSDAKEYFLKPKN